MPDERSDVHPDCPFCTRSAEDVLHSNPHALAFLDGYPLAEGHTLVVPRRHVASVFDASPAEQFALWQLVGEVRTALAKRLAPDAFNVGVNDGAAAGQTVGHGHVHVIPRKKGDVADPRGGVRWVLPAKAAYWSEDGS